MNCKEFRAAIARAGVSKREIAAQLGVSEQAFYNKLNGLNDQNKEKDKDDFIDL